MNLRSGEFTLPGPTPRSREFIFKPPLGQIEDGKLNLFMYLAESILETTETEPYRWAELAKIPLKAAQIRKISKLDVGLYNDLIEHAAKQTQVFAVDLLLRSRAKSGRKTSEQAPLWRNPNTFYLERLIHFGWEINQVDHTEILPIQHVFYEKNLNAFSFLLDKGANFDNLADRHVKSFNQALTAFLFTDTAFKNYSGCKKLWPIYLDLIKRDLNPISYDQTLKNKILSIAVLYDQPVLAKEILLLGADPHFIPDQSEYKTSFRNTSNNLLTWAIKWKKKPELVDIFMQHGASLDDASFYEIWRNGLIPHLVDIFSFLIDSRIKSKTDESLRLETVVYLFQNFNFFCSYLIRTQISEGSVSPAEILFPEFFNRFIDLFSILEEMPLNYKSGFLNYDLEFLVFTYQQLQTTYSLLYRECNSETKKMKAGLAAAFLAKLDVGITNIERARQFNYQIF